MSANKLLAVALLGLAITGNVFAANLSAQEKTRKRHLSGRSVSLKLGIYIKCGMKTEILLALI